MKRILKTTAVVALFALMGAVAYLKPGCTTNPLFTFAKTHLDCR